MFKHMHRIIGWLSSPENRKDMDRIRWCLVILVPILAIAILGHVIETTQIQYIVIK
ncbi:hypothetical protein [Gryllotalpicola koreensis]|uniref:Uncharacterized protein n=1 Tax=Gryllotalpicola koreensis TaxID=993086 RepID=A0ABP8A1Y0_9MICO